MTIRGKLAYAVLAVVLGGLGWAVASTVGHLWLDHQNLHLLVTIEQQRQLQARPPMLPTGPPAAGGS